ncbi:hypothetical protein K2173_005145 [Erythroxylum novogranatense]|uniref:Uncharacterized protein n=1 Tax=Erythroxylum novogranatense TaxID=1862640 RepID=A0AAV8TRG8_9ROSI|nr:hypothetical protein K2173_005145 [Erythroxylum novogranatense]
MKESSNFSWRNDQVAQPQSSNVQRQPPPPPGFKAPNPAPPEKSNLEDLLSKYISTTEVRMQNQESSIRHLENQMSQIASLIKERPSGSLPSNTEANPREHAKAILLRSGRQLEEVKKKQKDKKVEKSEEDESRESGKEATEAPAEKEDHPRFVGRGSARNNRRDREELQEELEEIADELEQAYWTHYRASSLSNVRTKLFPKP